MCCVAMNISRSGKVLGGFTTNRLRLEIRNQRYKTFMVADTLKQACFTHSNTSTLVSSFVLKLTDYKTLGAPLGYAPVPQNRANV
jgi:hypothetical protein